MGKQSLMCDDACQNGSVAMHHVIRMATLSFIGWFMTTMTHGNGNGIKEHALRALCHVLMDIDSHGDHHDEDQENGSATST